MKRDELHELLDRQFHKFNTPAFIEEDPISVPHQFGKPHDIEIAGFFAATFAWGQRKTIINKSRELMGLFENRPYDFIMNHTDSDLKRLLNFKHRTFNDTDLLYFIHFLRKQYSSYNSLEELFLSEDEEGTTKYGLINFYNAFVDDEHLPARTKKHVASPARKSTCKRINMYLRWMVRRDKQGVDFGLWKKIKPSMLVCPCDVHVEKVARNLGLLTRKQVDWLAAEELTSNLRLFDPTDPVKYDFALFGMGMQGNYN